MTITITPTAAILLIAVYYLAKAISFGATVARETYPDRNTPGNPDNTWQYTLIGIAFGAFICGLIWPYFALTAPNKTP